MIQKWDEMSPTDSIGRAESVETVSEVCESLGVCVGVRLVINYIQRRHTYDTISNRQTDSMYLRLRLVTFERAGTSPACVVTAKI